MTTPKMNESMDDFSGKDQTSIFKPTTYFWIIIKTGFMQWQKEKEIVSHCLLLYTVQNYIFKVDFFLTQPDMHNAPFSTSRQLKNTY